MSSFQEVFGVTDKSDKYWKVVYGSNAWTQWHRSSAKAADDRLIYGLEFEIENTRTSHHELYMDGRMHIKADGSLRNNGLEFVTAPLLFNGQAALIPEFFAKGKFSDRNYSDRCSIHVHANCTDLSVDQLKSVCLLYQTFEKLLFQFVGKDRDKNIFCVPWDQTLLTYQSCTKEISTKARQWQKYTALNLLPLRSLGTVEFRHMAGEYNVEKILNWLNLIGSLFATARNTDLDGLKKSFIELNTNSQYKQAVERVFTDWAHLLLVGKYESALSEGVLNMKYSLLEPVKPLEKGEAPPEEAPGRAGFEEAVREFRMRGLFQQPPAAEPEEGDDLVNINPIPQLRGVAGFRQTFPWPRWLLAWVENMNNAGVARAHIQQTIDTEQRFYEERQQRQGQ